VGTVLGAFLGAWVAAFGEDRAAGGFASRRGYAVTCRWLHGGVLLTVAAAGVSLSVVGVAERVFVSAPVVAAVSAALGCREAGAVRRGASVGG
jgi:hypothetical protein